jgi:hypothetical protein
MLKPWFLASYSTTITYGNRLDTVGFGAATRVKCVGNHRFHGFANLPAGRQERDSTDLESV